MLILSQSCFAICGHHLSPCIFHILLLCESYSLLSCHTGTLCASTHPHPPPDYWYICSGFGLVGPGPLHEIEISVFSRVIVHWAVPMRFLGSCACMGVFSKRGCFRPASVIPYPLTSNLRPPHGSHVWWRAYCRTKIQPKPRDCSMKRLDDVTM